LAGILDDFLAALLVGLRAAGPAAVVRVRLVAINVLLSSACVVRKNIITAYADVYKALGKVILSKVVSNGIALGGSSCVERAGHRSSSVRFVALYVQLGEHTRTLPGDDMDVRCAVDREIDRAVLVVAVGRFDAVGADLLLERAVAMLNEEVPSLLVDLTGVELIASAGIGTLVRLLHRVQKLDGRLIVFGANPRVRQVIDVVMLGDILGMCDTIEEARARMIG
jgi:anti-anti-sigma factor